MASTLTHVRRRPVSAGVTIALLLLVSRISTEGNPQGHTVAQGNAAFTTTGPQLDITTGGNAVINWQTFNIAPGETTYFHQPATSIIWNSIADPNASTINGTL